MSPVRLLVASFFVTVLSAQVSNVDWETEVYPILSQAGCLGCHGTSGDFTIGNDPETAHNNIVNVQSSCNGLDYVEPFSLNLSHLYRKVTGTQDTDCGQRMPRNNQSYFDDNPDQLELIRVWIEEGALPEAQAVVPEIVINEIHYNPGSSQGDDAIYEFLELYNAGDAAVDLNGWTVGATDATPADLSGTTIDTDGYVIVAYTGSTYEGLGVPVVDVGGYFGLGNSGKTLVLTDDAGTVMDSVTYDDGGDWPTDPDGGGPSLELINPYYDNSLVDSWGVSTETGGTPGAQNSIYVDYTPGAPLISSVSHDPANPTELDDVTVTAVITDDDGTIASASLDYAVDGGATQTVSMSNVVGDAYAGIIPAQGVGAVVTYTVTATDNEANSTTSGEHTYTVANSGGTSIADIQFNTTDQGSGDDCYPSPLLGQSVLIRGTVTGVYADGRFFIQDAPGAWNGVYVYDDTALPSQGDSLSMSVTVAEYFGLTEMTNPTGVQTLATGRTVPVVDVATGILGGGCSADGEAYEGVLVRLLNVTVTQAANQYGEWYVSDGSGECQVDDGMFSYAPAVGETFEALIGVVDYSFSEYGVNPRSSSDLIISLTAPQIGTPEISPEQPMPEDTVTVSVLITDDTEVVSAELDYSVDGGSVVTVPMSTVGDDLYTAEIPPQAAWAHVVYTITASDAGQSVTSGEYSYTVVGTGPVEVWISEYVEGTSNNKYIEVYNGTGAAVNLTEEGYALAKTSNGDNVWASFFSDWGSFAEVPAGAVVVLAAEGHDQYADPDTVLAFPSPVHFNGNDAVGLFRYTVPVDVVGYPDSDADFAANVTLRRKNTITQANTVYDPAEWDVFETNSVDGLGFHTAGAPTISELVFEPSLVMENEEITISALITDAEGSVAAAEIRYGTDGNLLNTAEMFPDGDIWIGLIEGQSGNLALDFRIAAVDDEGNEGLSALRTILIANAVPDQIADIHDDLIPGEIVTLRGVITEGSGVISTDETDVYLQDPSGRGLNLFDFDYIPDFNRGDSLLLVGYVEIYFTTVEVVDFIYEIVATDQSLPDPVVVSVADANSTDWEGTLIQTTGMVTAGTVVGGGTTYTFQNPQTLDEIEVRVEDVAAIPALDDGSTYQITGVGAQFSDVYRILMGYPEDAEVILAVDPTTGLPRDFALYPAYPNPFNPSTTFQYSLPNRSPIHLAVYDLTGSLVRVLETGILPPGLYTRAWNGRDHQGRDLPSGVYLIRLQWAAGTRSLKVALVR